MAIYETTSGPTGNVVNAGTENWTSFVPGSNPTRGLLRVMGSGNDKALNSPNMRVRVVEVDTDGSTGSAATARCISDSRVSSGVPTGKQNMQGTTTQIPNGNLRTLHDEPYNPGEPFNIPLYDPVRGVPLQITPGKIIAVGVTPDALGAATNTIKVTIQGCDV